MARLKACLSELDIILMTGSIDDLDDKLIRAIRSPAFYFIQTSHRSRCTQDPGRAVPGAAVDPEQNRRHLDRLETEIAEARAFQQKSLPMAIVNRLAIACRYTPWPRRRPGPLRCGYSAHGLIADVSGHGVSAAMLTGVVKSAFHASRVDGYEPLAVVHRVWAGIAAFSAECFVTSLRPWLRRTRAVCDSSMPVTRRVFCGRGAIPSGWPDGLLGLLRCPGQMGSRGRAA